MNKITFLTVDQIIGNKQLDIFKQYGTKAAITDFSILLGGFVLNNYHVNDNISLDNRAGMWLTNSFYNEDSVYIVDHRGYKNVTDNIRRDSGIRPVLLCDFLTSNNRNKIFEADYGEFPQTITGFYDSLTLEALYNQGKLLKTGKIYTVDMPHSSNSNAKFMSRELVEYYFNNQKYIRFVIGYSPAIGKILSDGSRVIPNSVYWIKVEPIKMIVDSQINKMISKKIIISGIQFNDYDLVNNRFEDTFIYYYLNKYFMENIIPSTTKSKQLVKTR